MIFSPFSHGWLTSLKLSFLGTALGCLLFCACKPALGVVAPLSTSDHSPVPVASATPSPAAEAAHGPAIIWAHFMPQVPNAALHVSFDGNNDAWPLNSQHISLVEDYKEHIRLAIESGIGGFQMLAGADKEIYEAARQVQAETGHTFYVAPEWCDTKPNDPVKWADTVAGYITAHRDDPHVFRLGGRMLLFTYYSGKWESSPAGVKAFRDRLAERQIDPLIAPTISDKVLLDRTDLAWRAWPADKIEPGPLQWLKLGWPAATAFDMQTDPRAIDAITARLRSDSPDFLFIPSLSSGYDSSNRSSQAIRVPFRGLHTLFDGFSRWRAAGFRQFTYVTWNDCNETLLVPSSRNVWGYNTIVRYFQGLLNEGSSPFSSPQVVVAYPAECIYGDKLDFQILALPPAGQSLHLRAKVEWQPVAGGEPIVLQGESSTSGQDGETFLSLDYDSGAALGRIDALQPRITVETQIAGETEWRILYDHLLLPPTHLTYNLVRLPSGYAIHLARVSAQSALRLDAADGLITNLTVTASTAAPIRRLHLNDGSRSLGLFRASGASESARLHDLFLRIETSVNLPLQLALSDGSIHDLYTKKIGSTFGITSLEKEGTARFPSFADGNKRGWRAVRIDSSLDGQVRLEILGSPDQSFVVSLAELARRRVVKNLTFQDKPVTVSLGLTSDGTDPNIDFPLSAEGRYEKHVPLFLDRDGPRVVYAAALLASGQMAYSPAVGLDTTNGKANDGVPAPWIATGGAFDDFNRNGYSKTFNPFTTEQVHVGTLPRSHVPYFRLDFEEGAGPRLNDRYAEHQAGRAWLEQGRGKSHAAAYDNEANGHYSWVPGRKGLALQLGEGERIRFRSKSSPVGPSTLSLWLEVSDSSGTVPGWRKLDATPFDFTINPDGASFTATFEKAEYSLTDLTGEAAFHPGWNHLVFIYDLQSVSIFLNGALAVKRSGVPPLYQRTHNSPSVSFAEKASRGLRFTGKIDELEVIGTAINETEIQHLSRAKAWRQP